MGSACSNQKAVDVSNASAPAAKPADSRENASPPPVATRSAASPAASPARVPAPEAASGTASALKAASAPAPAAAVETAAQPASNARAGPDGLDMRLLHAKAFASMSPVPPYEAVPASAYIECPLSTFLTQYASKTGVVSWRWGAPKPATLEEAKGPAGAAVVPPDLVQFVASRAASGSFEYVWLDWACVPQYQGAELTMKEINRSGTYYREAGTLLIWCYDRIQEDKQEVAYSDFFTRAWTLSERLHRSKGKHPVCAVDVLPPWYRPGMPGFLLALPAGALSGEANSEDQFVAWIPKVQAIVAIVRGASNQLEPADVGKVADILVSRYGKLNAMVAAVDGPFRELLDPATAAGMKLALQLRAFGEWFSHDASHGGNPSGMDAPMFLAGPPPNRTKSYLLSYFWNYARQTINNLNMGSNVGPEYHAMAQVLDEGVEVPSRVQNAFSSREGMEGVHAAVSGICTAASDLWTRAVVKAISEKLDRHWVRRYLVFDAGTRYTAWHPGDMLFAIYKLFDIPDAKYGQEMQVWRGMAKMAGIETGDAYAWLRNISRPGPTLMASARFVAERLGDTLPAVCAKNFGIFSMDHECCAPARLPLPFPEAMVAPEEPEGPWSAEDRVLVTYMLGARMDANQAYMLANDSINFDRVNVAEGTEIDNHLSLRGRRALQEFEQSALGTIKDVAARAPKQAQGNGLFLALNYHGWDCHCRLVVAWGSTREGPSGDEWCLEVVASVGGPPCKGSTWGAVKFLENVGTGLVSTGCAVASTVHGDCSPQTGMHRPEIPGREESDRAVWWSKQPISLMNYPQLESVPEPAVDTSRDTFDAVAMHNDALEGVEHAGDGASPDDDADGGAGSDGDVADPFGGGGLQQARDAFLACSADLNADTLGRYLAMLSRNKLHERDMAKHMRYYAALCELLAGQVAALPGLLGSHPLVDQKMGYLIEDLGDAFEHAEEDSEQAPHVEATKAARNKLREACEAAGLDL